MKKVEIRPTRDHTGTYPRDLGKQKIMLGNKCNTSVFGREWGLILGTGCRTYTNEFAVKVGCVLMQARCRVR